MNTTTRECPQCGGDCVTRCPACDGRGRIETPAADAYTGAPCGCDQSVWLQDKLSDALTLIAYYEESLQRASKAVVGLIHPGPPAEHGSARPGGLSDDVSEAHGRIDETTKETRR